MQFQPEYRNVGDGPELCPKKAKRLQFRLGVAIGCQCQDGGNSLDEMDGWIREREMIKIQSSMRDEKTSQRDHRIFITA
jgi:hypothetical protein